MIKIIRAIGLISRVFANGQFQVKSDLMPPCLTLSIIR